MSLSTEVIVAGARSSLLSRKQLEEVLGELRCFHPQIVLEPLFVDTLGDSDQKTSLRTLEKTDFFTRELDLLVLQGQCRIAIHSAKDLPEPLPKGLALVAMTKGLDPADALVLRAGGSLDTLPVLARIGSSSARRDAMVKTLLPTARFIDIRGTIETRLAQLDAGQYDAIVMAEAALIRLGLSHRTRIRLPGKAAPFQGRLAIIAKEHDEEMKQLFGCLHVH